MDIWRRSALQNPAEDEDHVGFTADCVAELDCFCSSTGFEHCSACDVLGRF
jgi:hypothetical protein